LSIYDKKAGKTYTLPAGRTGTYTFSDTGKFVIIAKYSNKCTGCDTQTNSTFNVTCKPTPCAAKASFTVDSVASNGKMYVKNTSTGAKSYVWNFGDSTAASKDKTPVHQFSASGAYTVCLTAYDSTGTCSTTYCYTVKVIKTRSNKSNIDGSIGNSYPNPADAGFYVNLGSEKSNYVVYNGTGQIIAQGDNSGITFVDSKNWANGIYQISIKNATGNRTESVMIAH
jgi:PKD repeat protein